MQSHGYEYPKTWTDMMALCEEIKGSGIAPWETTGVYPQYIKNFVFDQMLYKHDPQAAINIDNLEADAWKQPAVTDVLEALYMLAERGYLLPGWEGLDHIQSQNEWLQGKAVFIPVGTWLENEMKDSIPEGFNMVIAPTPSLPGDKLLFAAISAGAGEPFIVPSQGKNVPGGKEWLRLLFSKEAGRVFAENTRYPQHGHRSWLGDPKLILWAIVAVAIWSSVGFYMVIYIARCSRSRPRSTRPRSSTARRARSFKDITLPLIWETIRTTLIYLGIAALDLFVLVQVMTGGGSGPASSRSRRSLPLQPGVRKQSVGVRLGDRRRLAGGDTDAVRRPHAPDATGDVRVLMRGANREREERGVRRTASSFLTPHASRLDERHRHEHRSGRAVTYEC